MSRGLSNFWREPLVHFLLIGLIVFFVHAWLTSARSEADRTISISAAQMQRLSLIWTNETGREPTAQDIEGMLADYVREEVLYREALRLGLVRDDTIIRRRLAQKLGFIIAREEGLPALDEAALRAAFDADPTVYARPDRLSFVHVPYNFPSVGGDRSEEMTKDLSALQASEGTVDPAGLGDPFLLSRKHEQLSEAELTRLLGRDFAAVLFAQADGQWVGPIRSRLADHLVRIESRVAGGVPAFEDILDEVRARESDLQRRRADTQAWLKLREQYVVRINDGP